MRTVSMFAAVLLLSGCLDSSTTEPDMKWADPATINYASELEIDLSQMTRLSSGVYIEDLEEGDGEEATIEHEVTVRYTGWLPDGREFDSTRGEDPATFSFDQVIDGWDQGVPGMRVRGKRKLVIPPEMAFGPNAATTGRVTIPPFSTVIFDVELIAVRLPEEEAS